MGSNKIEEEGTKELIQNRVNLITLCTPIQGTQKYDRKLKLRSKDLSSNEVDDANDF